MPPASKVRTKTAVSVVTWRHAERRAPFNGFSFSKRPRISFKTGIAISAQSTRSRPLSANEMSLISYSKLHLPEFCDFKIDPQKSQIPSSKSQINSNSKNSNDQKKLFGVLNLEIGN